MSSMKKPGRLSFSVDAGKEIHYDDLLKQIGEFGRYQKVLFVLGNIFSIACCVSNMGYVFIADAPTDHWCKVDSTSHLNLSQQQLKNLTLPPNEKYGTEDTEGYFDQCWYYVRDYTDMTQDQAIDILNDNNGSVPKTEKCSAWTYVMDPADRTSIINDWNLVCDNSALPALSQSIFMVGLTVGGLVFGVFGDRFGRRLTLIVCTIIFLISYICTAFSQNYIMFVVMRFLVAFSSNPIFTTWFILSSEVVGPSWRVFAGMGVEYFWVIGYLMITACAYFIEDWGNLQLALSVPFAVCLPIAYFMPESPKWVYTSDRDVEGDNVMAKIARVTKTTIPDADKVMAKIARINKTTIPEKFTVTFDSSDSAKSEKVDGMDIEVGIEVNVKKDVYFWDIFRYPVQRIRMLILFLLWFVVSLSFYGLSLNATNLSSNKVLSFLLIGVAELPAYIVTHFFLDRVGRRPLTAGTLILGGVCMLATLAVPDDDKLEAVVLTLTMVGKFGVSSAYAICYIYTSELLPTVIRNSGLGAASVFARIGGVLAPQMALLADINKNIPMISFGALALIAGVAGLWLPETAGKVSPETMEEGERFGRRDTIINRDAIGDDIDGEDNQGTDIRERKGSRGPGGRLPGSMRGRFASMTETKYM